MSRRNLKTSDAASLGAALSRVFQAATGATPVKLATHNPVKSLLEESEVKEAYIPIHKTKKILQASRVPSSRIERLFQFTTLGLSLGSNLLTNKLTGSNFSDSQIDAIVSKLTKMRGAALKMGQMISIQDSLAPQIAEIMKRVQNGANYMPQGQLERTLARGYGKEWRSKFQDFEIVPFAAASIGQVHRATLIDGTKVAVKVQYPGVQDSIDSDLDNLVMLLSFGKLLPKGLYLDNTVRVARVELKKECDYIYEADSMVRYSGLLKESGLDKHFYVPKVFKEMSTGSILVSEFVEGETIDNAVRFSQAKRDQIGSRLLNLSLTELFVFRFMQTDPNFSNFLYNQKTDMINLIDFGAAREFSVEFTDTYLELLKAGGEQDREAAIRHSITLGFLSGMESEAMLNAHTNSLFTLAKPFQQQMYDFGKSNDLTATVRNDIPVMLRERLQPPPDETYSLHRKLSGSFLLCSKLGSRIATGEQFSYHYNEYKGIN